MPKTSTVVSYDPVTGYITKDGRVTGTVGSNGYVVLRLHGKTVYAHRLAWLLHYGVEPQVIDHKNGDRADNRIDNLRSGTHQQNNMNTVHGRGRHWHKPSQSWKSSICINGRQVHLGYFASADDAAECYAFAKEFFHQPHRKVHHA